MKPDAHRATDGLQRVCAVAPMMDWTDRHCRMFLRTISPSVLLYTEMVTAAALLHGDRERLLAFDPAERPLALQLGGCEPAEMARAAAIAVDYGYDEINMNVGCPSDRVQSGRFGACLMAEPERVAECVAAMQAAVPVPVTVKSRIGIDDRDQYEFLDTFVTTVASTGCSVFIVHARTAILAGLSPRQNREVPPLRYPHVHRLKSEHPDLTVVINGGLRSLDAIRDQLQHVDGVMIGRQAYSQPWFLAEIESALLGGRPPESRTEVVNRYLPYVRRQCDAGERMASMTRHMLGLFAGQPGARAWRRHLSTCAPRPGAGPEILIDALRLVADRRISATP